MLSPLTWVITGVAYYIARRYPLWIRLLACAGATLPYTMVANALDEREAEQQGRMLSTSGLASTYVAGVACGVLCGLVFCGVGKLFGLARARLGGSGAGL